MGKLASDDVGGVKKRIKKEGEKEMEMREKGCVRREWWVVPSLVVDDYATTSGRGEKLSVSKRNR